MKKHTRHLALEQNLEFCILIEGIHFIVLFLKSRSLRPEEPLFKDKYESWKRKIGKKGTVQKPRNK
ncbi:MAG: hypothetical protein K8R75_02275 [Deltaproteobacteria bacterium]|nr:hypothetical protein [Deltaproteobacteria bacterium]